MSTPQPSDVRSLVKSLNAEELSQRLVELEAEREATRVLLRAALARDKTAAEEQRRAQRTLER
jgi:hypothetical protein